MKWLFIVGFLLLAFSLPAVIVACNAGGADAAIVAWPLLIPAGLGAVLVLCGFRLAVRRHGGQQVLAWLLLFVWWCLFLPALFLLAVPLVLVVILLAVGFHDHIWASEIPVLLLVATPGLFIVVFLLLCRSFARRRAESQLRKKIDAISAANPLWSLQCDQCGKTYLIGGDAILITEERLISEIAMAEGTVNGESPVQRCPDVAMHAQLGKADRNALYYAVEYIKGDLSAGHWRRWRCKSCEAINKYPAA